MTIPILPAMPPIAVAPHSWIPGSHDPEPPSTRSSFPSRRLDLSAARAHDAALAILGAYKLTGNFHINLQIVLKNLGVLDMVTPEIEPETSPFHSDRRHVVFQPAVGVAMDRFTEITRSIADRIGFDAQPSWWGRLFHWPSPDSSQPAEPGQRSRGCNANWLPAMSFRRSIRHQI